MQSKVIARLNLIHFRIVLRDQYTSTTNLITSIKTIEDMSNQETALSLMVSSSYLISLEIVTLSSRLLISGITKKLASKIGRLKVLTLRHSILKTISVMKNQPFHVDLWQRVYSTIHSNLKSKSLMVPGKLSRLKKLALLGLLMLSISSKILRTHQMTKMDSLKHGNKFNG